VILPVILCGCEFVTLREELRLRVSGNVTLMKILGVRGAR